MNLILIGPKQNNLGGATISFEYLLEELDNRGIDYECIKTDSLLSKSGKIVESIKHSYSVFKKASSDTVISVHASNRRAALYTTLLNLVSIFTGAQLITRVFGGNHDDYLKNHNFISRQAVIASYKKNILLLQTKGLIKVFKQEFDLENVKWFPTSRPKVEIKAKQYSENKDKSLKILFLGHIKYEKGIYDLLRVAKRADENNLDIQISLYGELEEKSYQKEISDLNSSKIKYKGVLDKKEVFGVMQDSDLLAFPSKYEGEGYPGVLIEGINMNLPIIATNHKYNSELVRDGVDGILYDPEDSDALWECIDDLASNRKKLRYFHDNLKQKKEKFYSEYWNGEYFIELVRQINSGG